MKKLFLLAAMLAAVLSGGSAGAQNSVITQRNDMAYNIISTLVCEYHHPQTIACFNTTDKKAVFVLDSQIHQTIEVELGGYYINDIAINETKDTLFFCGRTYGGPFKGIIGFFRIPSVFNGSGSIYVQDYFYVNENNNHIEELTRMVYYRKTDGTPYLACIGRTDNNYPCLVDMNLLPMGGYTAGYVKNTKEKFTDIKVVSYMGMIGSYLMTAGTESSNGTYISLRYYDIDNVISSPGDQDYVNVFCSNPIDMREWLDKDVLLTPLDSIENTVSTVSYRRHHESLPRTNNNIHVAYYDLSSLIVNHSLFSMVKSIEIPYVKDDDNDATLHRYINQRSTDKTLFLQTTPNSTIHPSTFCELDYSVLGTAGTVNFTGDSDIRLQGLSEYNGTAQYVMSGFSASMTTKLMYEMETFGTASTCVESVPCKYEDVEPMASMKDHKEFNIIHGISDFNPKVCEKKEVPLFTDCPIREEQE